MKNPPPIKRVIKRKYQIHYTNHHRHQKTFLYFAICKNKEKKTHYFNLRDSIPTKSTILSLSLPLSHRFSFSFPFPLLTNSFHTESSDFSTGVIKKWKEKRESKIKQNGTPNFCSHLGSVDRSLGRWWWDFLVSRRIVGRRMMGSRWFKN